MISSKDIKLAEGTSCFPFELLKYTDPGTLLFAAEMWLDDHRVLTRRKAVGRGSTTVTTRRKRVIYTPPAWEPFEIGGVVQWETVEEAAHIVHEITHVIDNLNEARYILSPDYRWVSEVRAFRAQAQALLTLGWSRDRVARWAEDVAHDMPKKYLLGIIDTKKKFEAYRIITLDL